MTEVAVRDLGEGRQMIDLGFRDTEGLVASYVLPLEDGVALVETGPTPCRPRLLEGLRRLGREPEEVRQVFVTHIHLDHAGGLGACADRLPNATLYVHEKGAAHLIDPTRLIASARRAWGEAADPLWGTIAPVPAPRLVSLRGGESFPVRGGELRVVATPGHASHHLSLFDTRRRALLTGDSLGVKLPGDPWPRPAIPPPGLDLELLFRSVDAMAELDPVEILYSHFGPSTEAAADLREYRTEVRAWRDAALAAARTDASVPHIAQVLRETEAARRAAVGRGDAGAGAGEKVSGTELAAQGLLRYFRTHGELAE